MNREELKARTKKSAHRCVKLGAALPGGPLGRHVQSQLLRSATGAAANYRAACVAQSRAASIAKLSIVVEEVDESCFWVEFLLEERLLAEKRIMPLLDEARELAAIFVSARRTSRKRNSK